MTVMPKQWEDINRCDKPISEIYGVATTEVL